VRSPGVNVSVAYAWWPVFRCRSMAGFGCLPRMRDIDACDAWAGHAIYPAAEETDLQSKLDWLEQRRLNLFSDAKRSPDGLH